MYLALYRKYRPQTFDDVVAQEHVTKTLKNQIMQGKTAHAYLFTGSRGTGKTTCAKIFAKAVNCTNPQNGEPCLECDVCKGIDEGSVTDVVEIDAASNNGVENIRELRETAFFTPTFAKYRVYIIDEVHMLSVPAFNALLKIMEEPPAHVKFILATTEVHKVPVTVISRCQRFDFKRIKDEDIAERLKVIAKAENVSLDDDAADLIARLADGALRDGISLLDRILASSDTVTLESVENSVGVSGSEYLFDLTECIASRDSASALVIINELYMGSKDLQRLCSELINHFRNLMLIKSIGDCGDLVKATAKELERMNEQQQKFSMSQIISVATKLQECNDKIEKASNKRIEFEMCLIKLCNAKASVKQEVVSSSINADTSAPKSSAPVEIPKLPRPGAPVITPVENKFEDTKAQQPFEIPKFHVPNAPKIHEEPKIEVAPSPIPEPIPIPDDIPEIAPIPAEPESVSSVSEEAHNEDNQERVEAQKSTSDSFIPVTEWDDIIKELISKAPHLAAIKSESKAFIKGNNIYIGVSSPLINAQLKRDGNAAYLHEAIKAILKKEYKIKLKADSSKKVEKAKPIDVLIADAKALGIEIEE